MRTWVGVLVLAGVVMTALLGSRPVPGAAPELVEFNALNARLARMERQARLLSESASEVEDLYWSEVAPIERALRRRARDPELARQAAWALVRESHRRHLSPALLAAVLQVENPWLISDTASYAGAVGWMQIMPFHAADGAHPCGPDLTDGPTSVCYGADILRQYLGRALDEALRVALLRYNGCVRTPGCEIYATHVLGKLQ